MNLINKLPSFYHNKVATPIQNALTIEADILNKEIDDTINQLFVDRATWGLDFWEEMLRISKNSNLSIQVRRENIKAKRRSKGTTKNSTIKNICEAYSNGQVDIKMHKQEQYFEIIFVGSIGIPIGLSELDKTIEAIKPCHLGHVYTFTYLTWDQFEKYNYSWNEWDNLNLTWDEFEVYSGKGVV